MTLLQLVTVLILAAIAIYLLRRYCAGAVNNAKRDLSGSVIVITGGTNGMGRLLVEQLADSGAKIISCSRNNEMANNVIQKITEAHPDCTIRHIHCDLADLESVRACADEIMKDYDHIDILVNNAGVMMVPFGMTKQGYETHIGVNYIGHTLLTMKLLPLIEKVHGRVINYSSVASFFFTKKVMPFTSESEQYYPMLCYAESKLAMAMMAQELSRRYPSITAVSLHPGCVRTSLWQHFPLAVRVLMYPILRVCFKSPQEGLQTVLHLVHSEDIKNGEYYADCAPHRHNPRMDEPETCNTLWESTIQAISPYMN